MKCAAGPALSAAELDARARTLPGAEADDPPAYEGPTLTAGASVTLLGYRSERLDGSGAYASGTLYLPTDGVSGAPLLVYVAGTTGLGDECAPSRRTFRDLERALPILIGSGNAVLVPDLIGLGTPGTYAYLEPNEAARSVLDGARAAFQAAPAGSLDGRVLVAGHSAGGHAALATQALQRAYAPELDLQGVAGVAPAWFDISLFGQVMATPDRTVDPAVNGNTASFIAMFYAGTGAAYDGEDAAWTPFTAGIRAEIQGALEGTCIEEYDGDPTMTEALFEVTPTIDALFEDPFSSSLRNCLFGSCSGVGMTWFERFAAARPPLDSEGAPLFVLAGQEDGTIPITEVENILDDASFGTGCCYPAGNHNTTASFAAPWLVDWVASVRAGDDAPMCPEGTIAQCLGREEPDGGVGDAGMDGGQPDGGVGDAGMDGAEGDAAVVLGDFGPPLDAGL